MEKYVKNMKTITALTKQSKLRLFNVVVNNKVLMTAEEKFSYPKIL